MKRKNSVLCFVFADTLSKTQYIWSNISWHKSQNMEKMSSTPWYFGFKPLAERLYVRPLLKHLSGLCTNTNFFWFSF